MGRVPSTYVHDRVGPLHVHMGLRRTHINAETHVETARPLYRTLSRRHHLITCASSSS